MAIIALDEHRDLGAGETETETATPGLPEVLDCFAEVIEAIDSQAGLDEILHLVARKVCALVECSRCSLYLKHSDTGLYRGQVIEPAGEGADERIRRLICGTVADRVTQEVLATRAPVFVRNAQDDRRTVRSIMQTWGVQSMLGVPMIVRDDVVGILYLDNEADPHPFTQEQQALASTFAQLAGIAILQAQRSAELRSNLQTVARQNELLRHSTAIEEKLTRLVLEGGTLADIATAASDLTGKPCAIHDAGFRRLAVGSPCGSDFPSSSVLDNDLRRLPAVESALAGLKPNRPVVVDAIPCAGLLHRFLVARVVLHGKAWGYLAIMEFGSRFTALDLATSRHAATAIAIELSVEGRATAADGQAREGLVRDLVNGLEDHGALVRRAERLSFRTASPHLVCLLATNDEAAPLPTEEIERAYAKVAPGAEPWLTAMPQNGVALVLELAEDCPRPVALARAKETVERLQARLAPKRTVLAALSSACAEPADYACAYTETKQVLGCLRSLRGREDAAMSLLAADDLGAARLMLTMVDGAEADRFTRNTLGSLLERGNRTVEELLDTVRAFFENDRSVRNSAKHLGVHENTIRYRLGRVLELTGLDVATDSAAQLTVQVALLILKIQGRLPTPA
jgi:sugar diacid utilization regulator